MKDGATPLMAAAGMGIVAPAQDEKRGTDRRGLAILDGGIVEPESRVLETVTTALTLGSDLEAVNPSSETALHIASAQGYERSCERWPNTAPISMPAMPAARRRWAHCSREARAGRA